MRSFSFGNTIVVINGVEIVEWADGDDVIAIKRLTPSMSHKVGASGSMMVSISSDKSGSFTFKLQQTSPSNKYLNNLLNLQEAGGATFEPVAILFQDTYRQDLATGSIGYITKPTDVTRGAAANNQEWEIIVERLDLVLGNINDAVPTV
jgi:hypothetical protein